MNMLLNRFFIVATVFISGSAAAADPSNYGNGDDLASMPQRNLQAIVDEPVWFSRIAAEDTTGNLKRCIKRTAPPVNGSLCSSRPKLCYFDTQDCDGVGAHPATKCFCDGKAGTQTWNCETEVCPVFPDPAKTGCGPIVNDPSCPESFPSGSCGVDTAEEVDGGLTLITRVPSTQATCYYGKSECCGRCSSGGFCQCDEGSVTWFCAVSDQCIPPCESETWTELVGSTCLEARTAIFAKYPGLSVICATASTLPTDYVKGYVVVLDETSGLVVGVEYGRYSYTVDTSTITTIIP